MKPQMILDMEPHAQAPQSKSPPPGVVGKGGVFVGAKSLWKDPQPTHPMRPPFWNFPNSQSAHLWKVVCLRRISACQLRKHKGGEGGRWKGKRDTAPKTDPTGANTHRI